MNNKSDGITLQANEQWSDDSNWPALPPLLSQVTYSERITLPQNAPTTEELLSLIMEVASGATDVFPYVEYVQLTANHPNGDAVGINSTLFHSGPAWAAAMHAEPHQQTGASGTTIGINIEATKEVGASGRVIGENVQVTGADQGINLQGTATWGIKLEGIYTVGLDLGANNVRLNAGQRYYLEPTGTAWIEYNPATNRIEIYRGSVVVASF